MSDRFSVLLYYRQGLSFVLALLFQGSEVHSANSHSWLATVAVLLGVLPPCRCNYDCSLYTGCHLTTIERNILALMFFLVLQIQKIE
jgi:hypothetical protein